MRFYVCLLLLFTACSHLPQIRPVSESSSEKLWVECEQRFPKKDRQLLHRIRAELPNGRTETLLGVSQIFPRRNRLHCVLMTIEGLVLLEADFNGGVVSIERAVPPFDTEGVAAGMINDIRLIFFPPAGSRQKAGLGEDLSKICRYELPSGEIEEVKLLSQDQTEIVLYTLKKKLYRSIIFHPSPSTAPFPLAGQMQLKAHGFPGYELHLMLLETERLIPLQ